MSDPDLLLSGATVIDATGAAPRENWEVLVRGGQILKVAPAGTVLGAEGGHSDPESVRGLQLIDLSGTFLIPGIIDCHVHATTYPDRPSFDLITEHPTANLLRCVPVLRSMLHSGVTTARDLSGADHGTRTSIDEGVIDGPRLQVALRILSVTGGHGDWRSISGVDLDGGSSGGRVADGPVEFTQAVREVAREGGDWVKIAASGGMGSPRSNPENGGLNPAELLAVVTETERQGLVGVAAHAQGTRSIRDAVAAGVRSIEHGYGIDAATIEVMGERGTWLVPTLTTLLRPIVADPQRPWVAQRRQEWQRRATDNLSAAMSSGLRIAVGTDAGIVPHDWTLHELGHLVDLGLSPMDALLAATSQAAELLGLANEVGTIVPGRRADLVALAVDPLSRPHDLPGSVQLVVSRGRVVTSAAPEVSAVGSNGFANAG